MKRILIIMVLAGIVTGLILAEEQKTQFVTKDVVCPKCGFQFKVIVVVHPDSLGGEDTDLLTRSIKGNPVSQNIWMCPKCFMAAFPPEFMLKLADNLKNLTYIPLTIKKDPAQISQDEIPAWLKHENAIIFYKAKGIDALSIAGLYIKASWASRLESLQYSPEMEKLSQEIWRNGIKGNYISLQKNYEDMSSFAENQLKSGKVPASQTVLWKIVYADLLRKGGNHLAALPVLDELKKDHAVYSKYQNIIDTSIQLCQKEKLYQQTAFSMLSKELEANRVTQRVAELRYVTGELARRTGNKADAKKWYEQSLILLPKDNAMRLLIQRQMQLAQ